MFINRKKSQRGFTAVELGAAIAGGLLFLSVVTFGIIRGLDNNRYSTMTALIGGDMASAIMSVYGTTGSLTSLTVAGGPGILTGAGVKSTTPWNTSWTVQAAGTASTVVIRFPLGGNQKVAKGPGLATTLSAQFPIVSTATFADPNLDVTYNVVN